MQNLGAYRVDRRIRHELYKEVLKTYSTVLIERGYHSLFFPGGTRCRSGLVEEKPQARAHGHRGRGLTCTLMRGGSSGCSSCPATINYLLTLEASTLIEDYLAEVGAQPLHHRGRREHADRARSSPSCASW
jgi:glycerol-3-phosphate O-acyltransferase